jgi:DNA-binding beta-propeller fold protein YncE
LTLVVVGSAVPAPSQAWPTPSPGTNLAAGKTCAYNPPPNYSLCTEAGDPFQLTDGIYNGSRWADPLTVGWQHTDPVIIDIDLGVAGAIGKVTFDTIAGSAQVTFPSAVLVFVSTDGSQYFYLADVLTESLPQTSLIDHRFEAGGLKGWGRYVRVVVLSGGFFIFSDELEVMEGSHTQGEAEYIDPVPIAAAGVQTYAVALRPWADQKNATLTLLREAETEIDLRAPVLNDPVLEMQVRDQIEVSRGQVLSNLTVGTIDYAQGPPYRAYEGDVFSRMGDVNAQLWPGRDFVVWEKGPWDPLGVMEGPIGLSTGAAIHVDMMNNEWATEDFVVTSCSTQDQTLTLSASDFQGPGVTIPAGDLLRIEHVVHTEALGFIYPDDAIVSQAEGPVILKPAVGKRIWLTFKTRGMDLDPGTYTSMVTVATSGSGTADIPVELEVWPLRFPDDVTCESVSWGYFDDANLIGHELSAAQDLVEHYNTALVLNHRYLPKPVTDGAGNIVQPLDFTLVDQMIAWNPECRLWLIWIGFEFGFGTFGTGQFGTPAWTNAFTQFVTQFRDHLATQGVGTDAFAFYWRDEPADIHWTQEILPASTLLKTIDPNMQVWANMQSDVSVANLQAALPYVDRYCPTQTSIAGARHAVVLQTTHPSWMYESGSSKISLPFEYYRWFSWKAWSYGLGGVGMWVYIDENAQELSDYADGPSFAMIYGGDQGVIGSKRWEAWRQGIADYEYLRMLTDTKDAAMNAGYGGEPIVRAEMILGAGVNQVVGTNPFGGSAANRDLPDQYRVEILQALVDIEAGVGVSNPASDASYFLYLATDGLEQSASEDQVLCYDPDGNLVWTYQEPGGQAPPAHARWFDLELGPNGMLWHLSFGYKRGYRTDRLKGRSIDQVLGAAGMLNPFCMTFGPAGDLFVGNESSLGGGADGGVQRYDGITGASLGQFIDVTGCRGLAFGPDGHLYMTTIFGNVWQWDGATGALIGVYTADMTPGTFEMVVNPVWHLGNLYVAHPDGDRIVRISNGGVTISDFVSPGAGGLKNPQTFVWTPDGEFLVTSHVTGSGPHSIKRYDGLTGAYIDEFATLSTNSRPVALAIEIIETVDPAIDYTVYTSSDSGGLPPLEDPILAFDSEGSLQMTFDDPFPASAERWTGITLGPADSNIYVTSFNLNNVYSFDSSAGSSFGPFSAGGAGLQQCEDLTFGPDGNLYVACNGQGVAWLNGSTGAILGTFAAAGAAAGSAFGPANVGSAVTHLYTTSTGGDIPIWDGTSGAFLQNMAVGLGATPKEPKWRDGYLYVAQGDRILYYTHYGYDVGAHPAVKGRALGEFVLAGGGGMTLACGFDWTPEGDLLVASTGAPNGVRRFNGRTGVYIDMFATLSATSTPTDIVVESFIRPVRGTMLIFR